MSDWIETISTQARLSANKSAKATLVFVHGMHHAAWCWEEYFTPAFVSEGYNVVSISLRNHGNSFAETDINKVSINDYVDDLRSVTEQLEEPPVLIGHSMGGFIVQKYLELYPAKGAALIATVPHSGTISASRNGFVKNSIGLAYLSLKRSLFSFINTPERYQRLCYSKDFPGSDLNRYFKKIDEESIRAYFDMIKPEIALNYHKDIPMLVYAAEKDRLLSKESLEKSAAFYNAEFVIGKDIAHNVMLDSSWKDCFNTIKNWLDKNLNN